MGSQLSRTIKDVAEAILYVAIPFLFLLFAIILTSCSTTLPEPKLGGCEMPPAAIDDFQRAACGVDMNNDKNSWCIYEGVIKEPPVRFCRVMIVQTGCGNWEILESQCKEIDAPADERL